MRRVRQWASGWLGLLLVFLVSVVHAPRVHAADDAFIRVVHGSPDAPAVDVYVNGKLIFGGIKFATVSSYMPMQVRPLQVQWVPQGATLAQGPIVISTTINARAAKEYSVIAMGKLAKIVPLVLEDDNTIGDPAKAKVRLIHLSPDSPAIDIVVSGQNELKLFANASYKSVAKYVEVDPAQYSFVIRPAETSVSKLDVRGLVLDASTVTTIYAFGLWSGTPKLLVGTSQDLRPQIILPETGGTLSNRFAPAYAKAE